MGVPHVKTIVKELEAIKTAEPKTPYRTNDPPPPAPCESCDGEKGGLEWTGLGSDWEVCQRCKGTGLELAPKEGGKSG